jgi:hypothetical protein
MMLAIGFSGCTYEEGPLISFVSKKERIANTWVVNTANINGTDGTEIPGFKKIIFFSAGACQIIYNPLGVEVAYAGTWALSDDNKSIRIDTSDELTGLFNYVSDWTILHLKDKILKVSYTDNSDLYIVEFKPEA